jgi:exopolyphosphatase/guanosine-5'-triphosphate,3'-diphosphate pyrophosphatase
VKFPTVGDKSHRGKILRFARLQIPQIGKSLLNENLSQRRAVIDVGTNSVKLLVADVAGDALTPVTETSKQTRLGAGFYDTRRLLPDSIAATAAAVKEFCESARELNASTPRLIATSAVRDASNARALEDAIRESCGLRMDVLSGQKEADWVFRGVTSDPKLSSLPVLILDVGGGSTEFIVGDNAVPQFRNSYSLGTVRLLEQLRPGDPPGLRALMTCRVWLRDFLRAQVVPLLKPALAAARRQVKLVGTGGTATLLPRIEAKLTDFDREKIESTAITLDMIRGHLESQWQLTLAERQKIVGLPAKRADVILTGIAIYEAIMEQFGFTELSVSTRGLRYWALLHP